MKLKIGKVYRVSHRRKGDFTGKVLTDDGDFCSIEITDGLARALAHGNDDGVAGEVIDIRKSLATFTEVT